MPALAKSVSDEKRTGLSPATVVSFERGSVLVRREKKAPFRATLAVAGGYVPHAGDRVLVAAGAKGEQYIVGVLSALREVTPVRAVVGGASAGAEARDDGEVLAVRDAEGKLLFEHRPSEGKSVVFAPHGNLEFRAEQGSIDLVAKDAVRVHSDREVVLDSPERVRMTREASGEASASSVTVDSRGLHLEAPVLETRARLADMVVGDARLVARSVSTAVDTVKQVVGVVETQATRIVERAKNVYRDVAELAQTRAGRMRLVADATLHVFGKRTLVKGETEVKVKGEKIYLA